MQALQTRRYGLRMCQELSSLEAAEQVDRATTLALTRTRLQVEQQEVSPLIRRVGTPRAMLGVIVADLQYSECERHGK